MADIALDADGLRRDRDRYHALLDQAEQQIAAWNERADALQQAIGGIDRLLALADDDQAEDGGIPRGRTPGRGVAPLPPPGDAAAPGAAAPVAARPKGEAVKPRAPRVAGPRKPTRSGATKAAAATEAVPSPAAPDTETPKGTDALRLVFEGAPGSIWTLAELIAALETKGWLPPSRRPEEGVRISLKRLAERGGVVRTDDGRWRLASPAAAEAPEARPTWPLADEPPAAADLEDPGPPPAGEAPAAPPPPRPASFGRPVGATITEV